jgi:hypothetical protein
MFGNGGQLIVLSPTLIKTIPAVLGMRIIDLSDPLKSFSWLWGIIVAIGYSWLVFAGERFRNDDTSAVSMRDFKPIEVKLAIHAVFLAILLSFMWIVPHILLLLHTSSSGSFHDDGKAFGLLTVSAMIALYFIEREWIFPKSEEDISESDDNSNESTTIKDE